jgi:hypothetical protein
MAYNKISDFVYDCAKCHTRCDGVSKGIYSFDKDSTLSEHYEQQIINRINRSPVYTASKTVEKGFPDIEIRTADNKIYRYLEVKVQQRTFMSVQKYLPQSGLYPSETVALNLSDLLRYFEIEKHTGTPVLIVWVLLNRACIVEPGKVQLYYQAIGELQQAYKAAKDKRRFRRQSGEGDVVDGVHKGVTVNYHFSLKELKQWKW